VDLHGDIVNEGGGDERSNLKPSMLWKHAHSLKWREYFGHEDDRERSSGGHQNQLISLPGGAGAARGDSHWLAELECFAATLGPAVRQDDAEVGLVLVPHAKMQTH
jgi:hypothetical protein